MEKFETLDLEFWKNKFSEEECDYSKVQEYLNFIIEAADKCDFSRYTEPHHIIPKCIDEGLGHQEQKVTLNGADHFRAHMKLVDCFKGKSGHQLQNLLTSLSIGLGKDPTPEKYEESRSRRARQSYTIKVHSR